MSGFVCASTEEAELRRAQKIRSKAIDDEILREKRDRKYHQSPAMILLGAWIKLYYVRDTYNNICLTWSDSIFMWVRSHIKMSRQARLNVLVTAVRVVDSGRTAFFAYRKKNYHWFMA